MYERKCRFFFLIFVGLVITLAAPVSGIMANNQESSSGPSFHCRVSLESVRAGADVTAVDAVLTVKNTGTQPIQLTFSSGQRYDFRLLSPTGEELWRWSKGRAFTMVFSEQVLGPKPIVYRERVPLGVTTKLPRGRYMIEGELAATPRIRCQAALNLR